MRATGAGNGVRFWWKYPSHNASEHGLALHLSVLYLGRADCDGFNAFVRQMKCFDGAGSAIMRAPCQVIQRVLKPVIFVGPLIAGSNAAENDHSIGHVNHLVGVYDDAARGKLDRE